MKRLVILIFVLILLFNPEFSFTQQTNSLKEEISITASTNQTNVPLNRTVDFSITIKWKGEQNRYIIEDFDNPKLTNFEIVNTSSSNIVEDINKVQYSKKVYSYSLKPMELGMGYVDGIFLKYTDNLSGESNIIVTKRIEIKVTKPIEEADYTFIVYIIFGLFFIIAVVYFIIFAIKRKRQKEIEKLKKEVEEVELETQYLEIIKNYRPDAGKDLNEFLNEVSQLLNKYISQKYSFEITGLNKNEIITKLEEKNVEKHTIDKINEIIEKSEVYRFSGERINLAEYELIYSSITSIIEENFIQKKKLDEKQIN
jgi:hypothetical protein